jgi:hypothetical protein
MKLEWHYHNTGKGADLYDLDKNYGVRVGTICEGPKGDCIALIREDGGWKRIAPDQRLFYTQAKQLVEVTVRLT